MDLQKTMEFLLEWQAKFSSDMELMDQRLNRLGEKVDKLADTVVRLADNVTMLATTAEHMLDVQQQHEVWLVRLSESNLRLAEGQSRNDDAIMALLRMLPRAPEQ